MNEITVCKHGVPSNLRHNCAYTDTRNKFIPAASSQASMIAGPRPLGDSKQLYAQWATKWNLAFFGEMDRLVRGYYGKKTTEVEPLGTLSHAYAAAE